MNPKKFIFTSLFVFFVYELTANVSRIFIFSGERELNLMLGNLVWAFLFVYIFTKGYEARGWLEGLRFGLLIGILINSIFAFGSTTNGDACSLPFTQAAYWFLLNVIQIAICGIIAATIYRPINKAT